MIKFNKKIFVIILSTTLVILFFLIPISKIINFNWLFAIDPWVHMSLTKNLEPENLFWYKIQLYDKEESVHYPTFMRTYLYEFHLITWADYIAIFKYFGFITRFFLLLVILIFVRRFILKDKKNTYILPIILCLSLWHSYFWTRAWITFPENFVLILHWMLLFFTTLYLFNQKNKYLFFIMFFSSLSIYYHNPSFIVAIFALLWFTIAVLYKEKWNGLYKLLIIWILTTILSLPVFRILITEYLRQFHENIWSNMQTYWTIAKILPPFLRDYIWFSSFAIIFFSILWIFLFSKRAIQKDKIVYFMPLFFTFIWTFILTNWIRFSINVPIDRMQWYFILPIIIVSSVWLLSFIKYKNIQLKILLFFILFLLSLNTVINSSSRYKLWRWELPVTEYLKNNTNISNQKYFFDTWISFYDFQVSNYNNILTNPANLKKWDYIITYWGCPSDSNSIYKTWSIEICSVK